MSTTILMQDWVTIYGRTATFVIQSEPSWLDISRFQDIAVYAEFSEFTGGMIRCP